MKIKRKENSINEAEKLARKGLIKEIIIVYFIMLLAIILLIYYILSEALQNSAFTFYTFLSNFKSIFAIPLLIYLLSIIGFWFLRKPDHIRLAYEKLSKEEFSTYCDYPDDNPEISN